jgi:hypothetical protein
MPRSRVLVTTAVVIAVVLIGAVAMKSRGNDKTVLKQSTAKNCPPVARMDAVATRATEPIAVDVLANDTDPDGDALVFRIVNTTGGTSTVDDGGTPTESTDDRVLFTPDNPAPASATIDYEAVDPGGLSSASSVAVTINDTAALPEGVHSASVTDPDAGGDTTGRCSSNPQGTTSSSSPSTTFNTTGTLAPGVTATTVKGEPTGDNNKKKPSSKSGGNTTTTKKKTTTTARNGDGGSGGGDDGPATTQPHINTTTTRQPSPSTTAGPPPTTPPACGAFPTSGTQEEQDAWRQCVRDHSGG